MSCMKRICAHDMRSYAILTSTNYSSLPTRPLFVQYDERILWVSKVSQLDASAEEVVNILKCQLLVVIETIRYINHLII